MGEGIVSNEEHAEPNLYYLDRRGIRVRILRYDRVKQRVIYLRDNYEHECFVPKHIFKSEFTRVME